MQVKPAYFLACLLLSACGTQVDSRHRAIDQLEIPPTLATANVPGADPVAEPAGATESDTSSVGKPEHARGLGSAVYLTDTPPVSLMLKQPFDNAWNTLGRALKQAEIKVTDRERNKGFYYVTYAPKGLFGAGNWFFSGGKDTHYLLIVASEGDESKISAELMNPKKADAASLNQDGFNDVANEDNSQQLLKQLHDIIHDDLKE